MTYQQFTAEWNGKQVTKYGGECVAGVAEFEAENNLPIVWGDAHAWINNPIMLGHYDWVVNNPNDPNQLPPQGAIVVWNLPNEHIAFFDHNISSQYLMTFGQNSGGPVMHFQQNHWAGVAGWYVPKQAAPPPPAPAPTAAAPAPVAGTVSINQEVTITADTLIVRTGPATNYAGGQANSTDGNLHKGTVITVTGWVHGQNVGGGNDVWLRSVHGHWLWSGGTNFNLDQTHPAAPPPPPPAPTPAPAPTPPPAPATPTKQANTVYTKLDSPLDLVTNKQPTHWWELGFTNDAHATAAATLDKGTPFRAFGKAQRTDGDKPAYFMTEEDFGQADTTGIPANNNGINTVDLSPPPPPPTPAAPAPDTVGSPSATPAAEVSAEPPAAPSTPAEGDKVHVSVDPNGWQKSYTKFLSPQEYIANANVKVLDVSDQLPPQQLLNGQTVKVAGTFDREGVKYYRTAKSAQQDAWYGVPIIALTRLSTVNDENDSEIDKLVDDIRKTGENAAEYVVRNEKTIATAAKAEGILVRLFASLLRRNKK